MILIKIRVFTTIRFPIKVLIYIAINSFTRRLKAKSYLILPTLPYVRQSCNAAEVN